MSTSAQIAPKDEPKFLVERGRLARAQAEEGKGKKREERRARVMAHRKTSVQHFEPYSRGVQYFIKYFLGAPTKPHEYPKKPTDAEKESQYWVERRSQQILKQLDELRRALSKKTMAEQDYFIARAKTEIRKRIQLPPFTSVAKVGDLRGHRPISLQIRGDVERELALKGICRMTFDWTAPRVEESAWNTAVVEVMARKSVDWLRLSMEISSDEAMQAPAIVHRWLDGKCREITQIQGTPKETYEIEQRKKLVNAQFARWRKKVSLFIHSPADG